MAVETRSSCEQENHIWPMQAGAVDKAARHCRFDGFHLSGPGSRCRDGIQSTGEVFWRHSFPGNVGPRHPNTACVFFLYPWLCPIAG